MGANIPASNIRIARAYEPAASTQATRVLVDRLWPRGVSKREAAIDHWPVELAPSTALRRWFNHEPARWKEFCRRYRAELAPQKERLRWLRALARAGAVTLVYGARDAAYNNAVALRRIVLGRPIA